MANDPTFETGIHSSGMSLVKADLGTKRVCPNCSARFYDLQKRPIECPKCTFTFEPEALYKQRRPRQPEAEKPVPERSREREEEELEQSEEIESEETEEAAVEEGEEQPALETAEEEEGAPAEDEETESAGMSVVEGEAEEGDIKDLADEEIAEENTEDEALLEDVGEEEEDVSGIIDTEIEKDER